MITKILNLGSNLYLLLTLIIHLDFGCLPEKEMHKFFYTENEQIIP